MATAEATRPARLDCAPQRAVDLETAMTRAEAPPRSIWLWRNAKGLVAPVREASAPQFAGAAARSTARGWPVATRSSGGLAVPHGPLVLCVSLLWLEREPPGPHAAYAILADLIQTSAAQLGVTCEIGEIAGAVCPGAWDLACDGRKVAGLAQRRTAPRADGRTAVLAHAMLFCGLDLPPAITAINAYYADLGAPHRFDPAVHANLCAQHRMARLVDTLATTAQALGFNRFRA